MIFFSGRGAAVLRRRGAGGEENVLLREPMRCDVGHCATAGGGVSGGRGCGSRCRRGAAVCRGWSRRGGWRGRAAGWREPTVSRARRASRGERCPTDGRDVRRAGVRRGRRRGLPTGRVRAGRWAAMYLWDKMFRRSRKVNKQGRRPAWEAIRRPIRSRGRRLRRLPRCPKVRRTRRGLQWPWLRRRWREVCGGS